VLTLVLGGSSSGKSGFAVRQASGAGGRVLFVATGQASDAEMEERIAAHRRERPDAWGVMETPLDVSAAGRAAAEYDVVLLDAVDAWLANHLEAAGGAEATWSRDRLLALEERCGEELEGLLRAAPRVICVSGEVGLSLVPPTAYGRAFADLLGRCNQRLARQAGEAYLVVAGRPLPLPSGADA
jgi:adenosyl cobinamide kinase/adenosyl cobinamide phosphate guanylyltransferase